MSDPQTSSNSARSNRSTNNRRSRSRSPVRLNPSNTDNRTRTPAPSNRSNGSRRQPNPAPSNTSNRGPSTPSGPASIAHPGLIEITDDTVFPDRRPSPPSGPASSVRPGPVDLTSDDIVFPDRGPSPPPDPASFADLDRLKRSVQRAYSDLDLGPFKAPLSKFLPIPKLTVDVQGKNYSVYPDYSTDDLVTVQLPGDRADTGDTTPDPRFLQGPRWRAFSCALDTFLWISAVCNIRRLRVDFPSAGCPEAQAKLSLLSQAITQYLHLPLGALNQQQINSYKEIIFAIMRRDHRVDFTPGKGMDMLTLINIVWGTMEGTPSHRFGWTEALLRRCTHCNDYGIKSILDQTILENSRVLDDLTLEQRMQTHFDGHKGRHGRTVVRPMCKCGKGKEISHHVVLDRLPKMLIWVPGSTQQGKLVESVLSPVTLVVDVANESSIADDIDLGGYTIWNPIRMRVHYKPVVIGIVDMTTYGANHPHQYAISCLPIIDGQGGWLAYDGMRGMIERKPADRLVVETDGAKILNSLGRGKDGVDIVILEKQSEEQVDWEERCA